MLHAEKIEFHHPALKRHCVFKTKVPF